MINIALLGNSFTNWGGGIDFLRLCANALALKSQTFPIKVFLLLPEGSDLITLLKNILRPCRDMARNVFFEKHFYPRPKPFDKSLILDSFRNINGELPIVFYKNTYKGLTSCLREMETDVVLPLETSLGVSFPIPWAGYIPDFQHRYCPQFFSNEAIMNRDHKFARLLKEAKVIIVNSKAVKDDTHKFFPEHSCRVQNLPFAPVPVETWFDESDFKTGCRLPERYFIISNQFWIHKSHITAFEALSKLKSKAGIDNIDIVCTGKTEDYRFPNYFNELKRKIVDLGLADRIHLLGYLAKKDQIHIMRNAIAVLQPTLFEGGPGGGSVYDAVAVGVPAIVSDIQINLEINEDNILFFRAGSADDMAAKMIEVLNWNRVKPDKALLINKGRSRTEILGDKLLEAVSFAIADS